MSIWHSNSPKCGSLCTCINVFVIIRVFIYIVDTGHAADVTTIIGQDVTLQCGDGVIADGSRVQWKDWVHNNDRNPVPIYDSDTGVIDSGHPNKDSLSVDAATYALTVSNVRFGDQGEYVCVRITADGGDETETSQYINVISKYDVT